MYKIVGKFYDEEINRESPCADYAISVYMAYIHNGMQYTDAYDALDVIDEAISVSMDVFKNDLPHFHELTEDMWLELRKE